MVEHSRHSTRSSSAPPAWSVKIRSQQEAASASCCSAGSCSSAETRAYPRNALSGTVSEPSDGASAATLISGTSYGRALERFRPARRGVSHSVDSETARGRTPGSRGVPHRAGRRSPAAREGDWRRRVRRHPRGSVRGCPGGGALDVALRPGGALVGHPSSVESLTGWAGWRIVAMCRGIRVGGGSESRLRRLGPTYRRRRPGLGSLLVTLWSACRRRGSVEGAV
jgi:hypothetical protein